MFLCVHEFSCFPCQGQINFMISLICHMIFGLIMTQLFKLVDNSGPVLKKIVWETISIIEMLSRLCENIQWKYGIKVDALDLKITTYASSGLQSPAEYCFVLNLHPNIKAVIFPKCFLIVSLYVTSERCYHFQRIALDSDKPYFDDMSEI